MSVDWGPLIPGLAHDMRALVRKGLTNAQFLKRIIEPGATEEVSSHLRAIVDSQTDLNYLLVRLVALAEAVLQARLECRDAIHAAGGELIVERIPACTVPSDIRIVLRELIDNALRFRDPETPPRMVIEADEHAGGIRVKVADNGTGLDADHIGGLFQPLHRLDARRSGFGLGLAISRAIVERHGGRIYCEPAAPGAVFVFELLPMGR